MSTRVFAGAAFIALWASSLEAGDRAQDLAEARWMCTVLRAPFDPVAAIRSFPLEQLPEPTEKRKSRERANRKDGTGTVVTVASRGASYEVEYRYQMNDDDVDDPYGFTLEVTTRGGGSEHTDDDARNWARQFGKAQIGMFGWEVNAGPPMFGDTYPFSFRSSAMGYPTRSANWFNPDDIAHAQGPCKRIKS